MALADWVPPRVDGLLARNGYARLTDLEHPDYGDVARAMEGFQAEFLARTAPVWNHEFPIPGDALAHFSRQWEFPYAWANLGSERGRVLDAGSGITFFPFLLATAGFEVECCDADYQLGLAARYKQAAATTGCRVGFTRCSLTELPYADGSFDAAVCISVLEHAGAERIEVVEALAHVLRPGGRLVLTWDVDLRRDGGLRLEEASLVLAELGRHFEFAFPLDLRRPPELLTSDAFLRSAPWRLPPPWRPDVEVDVEPYAFADGHEHFRSIAILAATVVRRGDGQPT